MYPYQLPKGLSAEKKYIIYGTGEIATQYYLQIKKYYDKKMVSFFVETNPTKKKLEDKFVYAVNQLKEKYNGQYIIIASVAANEEMRKTLISLDIKESKIINPGDTICNLSINIKSKINNILFYPRIGERKILYGLLQKIQWYLPKSNKKDGYKVIIPINFECKSNMNHVLLLKGEIKKEMEKTDVILVWEKESLLDEDLLVKKNKVYCVDPSFFSNIESEVFRSIFFYTNSNEKKEYFLNLSKKNFESLIYNNKDKKYAYLFGTGPSIEMAYHYNYSKGFNVICNSLVKDKQLLNHINPNLLVFADPVFHFSPCEYSKKFRANVLEIIREYNCYCSVPDYTVPLLLQHYPELESKIIGVPSNYASSKFNFPNLHSFYVRGSSNILTFLMIPIASAITSTIYLIGFDGRQPNETYFWKHNSNVQFNELMNTVFEMHPSFFRDRSYTDYYEKHCEFLKQLLVYGENQGKSYYSLTPSYIPALKSREIH